MLTFAILDIIMKLYNSLTKQKEEFTPISPGKVSMYHCGPTVYDYQHIGNLRAAMLGDFLRRVFEYNNNKVTQVMNITDVGHLVSDGDDGDDKMTKGLKKLGKEVTVPNMLELATMYADIFKNDLSALNILIPHHMPRASESIDGNIELIKMLEQKGLSYVISDGVYFDISKMPEYGKLGGLNLEDVGESRIGGNLEKRNQADFALWKFDDTQGWESPWGQGFPGWHIECSTMSREILGDHFDVHTGGIDLASIHHNNEIAQSTCATGSKFVNYWMHGEMLNFSGAKLSKSTGGNITLKTLEEKGFTPLAYRYLAMQVHYRSKMEFTWKILESAQTGLNRIYQHIIELRSKSLGQKGSPNAAFVKSFKEKINDDLNLPQGLAVMHEVLKSSLLPVDKLETLYNFDRVLGLGLKDYKEKSLELPEEVSELLEQRTQARLDKNWGLSDSIRDKISEMGYLVSDSEGEQKISKK